jgi:hypothetical protein
MTKKTLMKIAHSTETSRVYAAPELTVLGDVVKMTAAGSNNNRDENNDNQCASNFNRNFNAICPRG